MAGSPVRYVIAVAAMAVLGAAIAFSKRRTGFLDGDSSSGSGPGLTQTAGVT